MNFRTMQKAVTASIVIGFIICIVCLFLSDSGSAAVRYLSVSAVIFVTFALLLIFMFSRCPRCGSRIFRNMLLAKVCPFCGAPLYEGAVKAADTSAVKKKKYVHKKKKHH